MNVFEIGLITLVYITYELLKYDPLDQNNKELKKYAKR